MYLKDDFFLVNTVAIIFTKRDNRGGAIVRVYVRSAPQYPRTPWFFGLEGIPISFVTIDAPCST